MQRSSVAPRDVDVGPWRPSSAHGEVGNSGRAGAPQGRQPAPERAELFFADVSSSDSDSEPPAGALSPSQRAPGGSSSRPAALMSAPLRAPTRRPFRSPMPPPAVAPPGAAPVWPGSSSGSESSSDEVPPRPGRGSGASGATASRPPRPSGSRRRPPRSGVSGSSSGEELPGSPLRRPPREPRAGDPQSPLGTSVGEGSGESTPTPRTPYAAVGASPRGAPLPAKAPLNYDPQDVEDSDSLSEHSWAGLGSEAEWEGGGGEAPFLDSPPASPVATTTFWPGGPPQAPPAGPAVAPPQSFPDDWRAPSATPSLSPGTPHGGQELHLSVASLESNDEGSLLSFLHSELGDSVSGSDSETGAPAPLGAQAKAAPPELLGGPEVDPFRPDDQGRANIHFRDAPRTLQTTADYGPLASKICAAWGVAAHRDFVLPSPLTHVKQCVADTGEHLAVLRQQAGHSLLQVLWLGAPEQLLAPVRALRPRPPLQFAYGLSQEPPLGLRGAVEAPVLAEIEVPGLEAGAELLAVQFDEIPRDYSMFDKRPPIVSFVTATPMGLGRGPRRVQWHRGPRIPLGPERQELCQMQAPMARFSPAGAALVVQSVQSPPSDAFGFARLSEGVRIFYSNRADTTGGPWQPRYPFALLEAGVPAPTFAWTRDEGVTVMATHRGALLFDTKPTPSRPQLRPVVRLPLPQELRGKGTAVAGAISFDEHNEFMALNWATYDAQDKLTHRWGNVYLVEMFDTDKAAHAYEPLVLKHLPDHSLESTFRMVQFVSSGEQAIFAYGKSMYSAKMPARGDDTPYLPSHQSTGLRVLRTAERQAYLCALAERSPFYAMVDPKFLRMYFPTGNRNFGRGLHRFHLQERRPAYLEAFAAHGVTPSPNRLAVLPWIDASDRFVFAGLDDSCLHRWDLRPALWQPNLFLRDPQHELEATRRLHKTSWVPQNPAPGQSLPNII